MASHPRKTDPSQELLPIPRRRLSWLLAIAISAGVATALLIARAEIGGTLPKAPALVPPAQDVEATLFLIGDAGAPRAKGEPTLLAIAKEASDAPKRSVVLFLGDNVYSFGMPPGASPGRREAERRLEAQVAVCSSGCQVLFVPGNHDWDRQRPDGWEAVKREGEFLAARGVKLLPGDGLPGPAVVDVGARMRLLLLDTQWWLQEGPKPERTQEAVLKDLEARMEESSLRDVVIAAHHPLVSGGEHGGSFGWRDHLFPLRNAKSWLWLPLPMIGSAYPIAREYGFYPQDVNSKPYRAMKAALEKALSPRQPLVYAAGHEHNLQVLEAPPGRVHLVSGGGLCDSTTPVRRIKATRYAVRACGFMRLDAEQSGRIRLSVKTVDLSANATEVYSSWLK